MSFFLSFSQPIQHLDEEFPEIARFLETIAGVPTLPPTTQSQTAQTIADVIARAQAQGREPDEEELRAAVGNSILDGFIAASRAADGIVEVEYEMASDDQTEESAAKRTRLA